MQCDKDFHSLDELRNSKDFSKSAEKSDICPFYFFPFVRKYNYKTKGKRI